MKKIGYLLFSTLISFNSFSQKKKDSASKAMDEFIEASTKTCYIVIAGTSSDFNSLDYSAKEISKKTGIPYDNNGMVYDKELGMIAPKDSTGDDIDAGQPFPRRYEENLISIEMMNFYSDNHPLDDQTKMIIITGIFENKKDSEKQLKLIQTAVPSAYIKKTRLYMGCMR